jgi:hypothetical protein
MSSALLTATLARAALHALLRDLWHIGSGRLGSLGSLLLLFLRLCLGDGSLTGSGSDFRFGGTFSENGSKVGSNDSTLK